MDGKTLSQNADENYEQTKFKNDTKHLTEDNTKIVNCKCDSNFIDANRSEKCKGHKNEINVTFGTFFVSHENTSLTIN